LTVAWLMNNRAAASLLVFPAATSSRTSTSRTLSDSAPAAPGPLGTPGVLTRLISRAATDGARTASPSAAAWTARSSSALGASLSRYPVAPA
jgi:hypothetical protein